MHTQLKLIHFNQFSFTSDNSIQLINPLECFFGIEGQDIETFGELFLRCMDMYSVSRTVENPQKMHHNECPTEIGFEHREESDRLVHYKSVLVVSNLPKGADEDFVRAVTLGCGKATNIEISDLGSNVGAHIALSKREYMVKACDQLNETVFNNVCLTACIITGSIPGGLTATLALHKCRSSIDSI